MANKVVKAEKIVNAATSQFKVSYDNIQKANSLLSADIEKDRLSLIESQKKIDETISEMNKTRKKIKEKEETIAKNDSLAESLARFI